MGGRGQETSCALARINDLSKERCPAWRAAEQRCGAFYKRITKTASAPRWLVTSPNVTVIDGLVGIF
jgi:hypothetical protein